ncbi:cupin domain-containing protein [Streptacidiphilus sp. 4-A2]|nr:cupin domain-containing protein [Streptacidiphilus sp. 4-A2]
MRAGPSDLTGWSDLVARLTRAPFVTIAEIRGRAYGCGNEFALACDLRFASQERAVFAQPEVTLGLVPGGGSIEALSVLAGRSRALEIILGGDDFSPGTAERYGWINRALPDAELSGFVDRFARRIAGFERAALVRAKAQINKRAGTPSNEDLLEARTVFNESTTWPGTQRRVRQALAQEARHPQRPARGEEPMPIDRTGPGDPGGDAAPPLPAFMDAEAQQAYWFLGSLVRFRVTGESTGGSLAVMEHRNEYGYAPPVHRHASADETLVVLEGELRAELDGASYTAGAGAAVFLPAGPGALLPHHQPEARYLSLHTPTTGFEAFTREAGVLDDGSGRPPQVPPDPQELRRIAARYDIEIIGPPPRL